MKIKPRFRIVWHHPGTGHIMHVESGYYYFGFTPHGWFICNGLPGEHFNVAHEMAHPGLT